MQPEDRVHRRGHELLVTLLFRCIQSFPHTDRAALLRFCEVCEQQQQASAASVATACSGTDSPILGLRALQEAVGKLGFLASGSSLLVRDRRQEAAVIGTDVLG